VARGFQKVKELTAAGTVQEFQNEIGHLIPYYDLF